MKTNITPLQHFWYIFRSEFLEGRLYIWRLSLFLDQNAMPFAQDISVSWCEAEELHFSDSKMANGCRWGGIQPSRRKGNDAWPTIIVVMFVMFVKHWEKYIKAISCELDKTWDQEIVDHMNMMIIHNIHGIIRITITEVHMIQTSSLFLQYHEVKVTCCLATVHQKCVGLASTGVCASLKDKYNQYTNSSLGDQIC